MTAKRDGPDHADSDRTVPTAYALNHAVSAKESADFVAVSAHAADTLNHTRAPARRIGDGRTQVTVFVRTRDVAPAGRRIAGD